MPRAKSKKFVLNGAVVKEEKNNLIITGRNEEDESEDISTYDIVEEITKFIGVESIKFVIKESKSKAMGQRKPTYKYKCPNCSKEVKSKESELKILCEDCNCQYEFKE